MSKVSPTVGSNLVKIISRMFTDKAWLYEIMQNAYRAHASKISITETDDGDLMITDNGKGVHTWDSFFNIADTGWDEDVLANQDPAGMGTASLLSKFEVTIQSGNQRWDMTPEKFIGALQDHGELEATTTEDFVDGMRFIVKEAAEKAKAIIRHHGINMKYTMSGEPMEVDCEWRYIYDSESNGRDVHQLSGMMTEYGEASMEDFLPNCECEIMPGVKAIMKFNAGMQTLNYHGNKVSWILDHDGAHNVMLCKLRRQAFEITGLDLYCNPAIFMYGEHAPELELVLPERCSIIAGDKYEEFVRNIEEVLLVESKAYLEKWVESRSQVVGLLNDTTEGILYGAGSPHDKEWLSTTCQDVSKCELDVALSLAPLGHEYNQPFLNEELHSRFEDIVNDNNTTYDAYAFILDQFSLYSDLKIANVNERMIKGKVKDVFVPMEDLNYNLKVNEDNSFDLPSANAGHTFYEISELTITLKGEVLDLMDMPIVAPYIASHNEHGELTELSDIAFIATPKVLDALREKDYSVITPVLNYATDILSVLTCDDEDEEYNREYKEKEIQKVLDYSIAPSITQDLKTMLSLYISKIRPNNEAFDEGGVFEVNQLVIEKGEVVACDLVFGGIPDRDENGTWNNITLSKQLVLQDNVWTITILPTN